MIVRSYKPSDLERVITVYREAIHSLAAPHYTAAQLAAWAPQKMDAEKWRQRLATIHVLAAEGDGIVAGFLSYEQNGHIDLLFTHPAFARQGVATLLYREAEAALRAAGVLKVFTEASLAARPFFERHGFRVDAEEFAECRGEQLRRFRMSKSLTAHVSSRSSPRRH
jgi:putative acetyltransferase